MFDSSAVSFGGVAVSATGVSRLLLHSLQAWMSDGLSRPQLRPRMVKLTFLGSKLWTRMRILRVSGRD